MNDNETRLARALEDEAATRDVDAHALLTATRERLARTDLPRRRRVAPAVAAAAAVALLAGGGAALVALDGDESPGVAAGGLDVDRKFTCPDRVPVDVSGAQDDFVPTLVGRGPADVAQEYGAPRWDFVENGGSARLFLGNEDGTLGSVAGYDRDGDTWVLREATACGNGSEPPTADGLRLGRHGADPHPARGDLDIGDPGVEPVLVDDRPVYDYSGLVLRHRSIYAAPCGDRLCLGVGEPGSGEHAEIVASAPGSTMHTEEVCFFQPDDPFRRTSPYRVMGVWDPTGTSTEMGALTALSSTIAQLITMQDLEELGEVHQGQLFEDPSWGGGKLWMAVVPRHDYDGVIASLQVGDELPMFNSLLARCGRVD